MKDGITRPDGDPLRRTRWLWQGVAGLGYLLIFAGLMGLAMAFSVDSQFHGQVGVSRFLWPAVGSLGVGLWFVALGHGFGMLASIADSLRRLADQGAAPTTGDTGRAGEAPSGPTGTA